MATNLHIDEKLLAQALKAGGHKTKRETVDEALREYLRHREQMRVVELFGTVDGRDDYDYKAQRRRDSGPERRRGRK
jgi:Arc/MetJ family transcription regulator